MNLGSKEGNFKYETKEEIVGHIKRSSALPLDDIWISGEDEYPCLAILINGDYACVHYFEEEGITWQSHGNFSEETIFLAGGEEWKAPADTVKINFGIGAGIIEYIQGFCCHSCQEMPVQGVQYRDRMESADSIASMDSTSRNSVDENLCKHFDTLAENNISLCPDNNNCFSYIFRAPEGML